MTRHEFSPTTYWNTMGSHPAALTIKPGDTVVTTTVDALGVDANGEQVATRGNPQTGPFHVEGAKPGDTLQYHYQINRSDLLISWRILEGDISIIDGQDTPTVTVVFGTNFTGGIVFGDGSGLKRTVNPVRLRCTDRVIVGSD